MSRAARGLVLALAVAAGACKGRAEPAPAERPVLTAVEQQRGQQACRAYVARVCACAETVATMKEPCALARPLVDALEVAAGVSANPDTARRDAVQAGASVRAIAKACLEQAVQLPPECPPMAIGAAAPAPGSAR